MPTLILIRGGGDLASGVALRLHRAGLKVLISELEQPLAVRRTVSFAEAVYAGEVEIEGVKGKLVKREQIQAALDAGEIPVVIDPDASILTEIQIPIVIDARLTKLPPSPLPVDVPLHIGLGPGFHAGRNCHAVIETRRSHTLGRVYWEGPTQPDSGQPEGNQRRVLRAPVDGELVTHVQIGDHVEKDKLIAEIQSKTQNRKSKIVTPFPGVIRGLLHPGLQVTKGLKIGDVDPRGDPELCSLVSDKALAIGGGVLEAILAKPDFRTSENNIRKLKGRLDNPILRFASILVAIATIFILLYSLTSSFPIIPVMTGVFFLMLWFLPQLWNWIEFVFSKRPSSTWGRFILNLVLSIIAASIFEDVLELLILFVKIIRWGLGRLL